ncbi:hypothetical protein BH10ACT9_BH10ACT9_15850 [soil metagenome]
MKFTAMMGTAALSAGIGAAALFGLGTGTAAAAPGQPCSGPGQTACQPDNPAPNQRGIDQGRQDHQPFNFQGQQVTPMPAGNGAGWGFWFLGRWIAL